MYLKAFIATLKRCLSIKIQVLRLMFTYQEEVNMFIWVYTLHCKNVKCIMELFLLLKEQNDTKVSFVESYLINSVKWKYDYIIFSKNF